MTLNIYFAAKLLKNIKREDAFLQAVNYLLEHDEEQRTIHDLRTKIGQLCENPFSFKPMKRR